MEAFATSAYMDGSRGRVEEVLDFVRMLDVQIPWKMCSKVLRSSAVLPRRIVGSMHVGVSFVGSSLPR